MSGGAAWRYRPPGWRVDADAVWYAARRAGMRSMLDLERASGVPHATLSHALGGQTPWPSADVMCRVADALGCDVMDLMRRGD